MTNELLASMESVLLDRCRVLADILRERRTDTACAMVRAGHDLSEIVAFAAEQAEFDRAWINRQLSRLVHAMNLAVTREEQQAIAVRELFPPPSESRSLTH